MGFLRGGRSSVLSASELVDLVIAETNRIATDAVMDWITVNVPEDMYRASRVARGLKPRVARPMVDSHRANWNTGDHYTAEFSADGSDHAEFVQEYVGVNWTKGTVQDKYMVRFREWWQANILKWADYARRLVMG